MMLKIVFIVVMLFSPISSFAQDWTKTQWGYGIGNCGPTCAAMIIEANGIPITVGEAREVIGYKREDGATSFSELSKILDSYSIEYEYINSLEDYIDGYAIILVDMSGISNKPHDYNGGHYLLISGYIGGFYEVVDPMVEDTQLYIMDEIKKSRYGKIIYVEGY